MSNKIDSRLPDGFGLGQLSDHTAIKTPWEKLISIIDANYYVVRHRGGIGSVFMEILRILIPDYVTRARRVTECGNEQFHMIFSKEGYNVAESSIKRLNIHPFMRGAFFTSAIGDSGDESLWMCGRVTDFGTHRVEKELDTCPWDIMGSEICRCSNAGMDYYQELCREANGGKGSGMRFSMVEAIGCGDLHCRIVGESYEKYPPVEREVWDNFGPIHTEDQIKFTPAEKCVNECLVYRDEADFKFRNGLCYEYEIDSATTAGYGGYRMSASSNLGCNYVTWVLEDMLKKGEVTQEELDLLFENMFEACGKMMFLDSFAIKGVRDWMGVPNSINDGRVLGSYIEIYLQAITCPYDIVAFNGDEVIYDIDLGKFSLGIPMMKKAYLALWYGMVKTMVNCQWFVWEETDGVPEGKFRIKIGKKIDKFAR